MEFKSKNDLLRHAKSLVGKRLSEVDRYNRLEHRGNKGGIGQMIEESHFEYGVNSSTNPDFPEQGVELKATPIRQNRNGTHSAKERLVLNIIDFHSEVTKTFETSSFWMKNKILLIVFYLFQKELERGDYEIIETLLYEYPEEDLEIIKDDWEKIISKIKAGEAHELSESDTLYLGACPKGASRESVRGQPFSSEDAMQRAYSLKQSYMTELVRNYVIGKQKHPKIIKDVSQLKEKPLETIIYDKLSPFFGHTQRDLCDMYQVKTKAKHKNEILVAAMLDISGKISKTEEFQKANIVTKTIRLKRNGKITESMSFPTFKFKEIVNETWEDSTVRDYFLTTRFMFVIFDYQSQNHQVLKDVQFWSMPLSVLDSKVRAVWEHTQQLIRNGNIVKKITPSGVRQTNFPRSTYNRVCHVRPHGQTREDMYPLPVPDKLTGMTSYTKQCFWLNNTYIASVLNK